MVYKVWLLWKSINSSKLNTHAGNLELPSRLKYKARGEKYMTFTSRFWG